MKSNKPEQLFVTALSGIRISEGLGRGDRLNDETFITNDVTSIGKWLDQDFERFAGLVDTNFIRAAPAVVYSVADSHKGDSDIALECLRRLRQVNVLLLGLWLIRDNSVNHDVGFLARRNGPYITMRSQSMATRVSKADGTSSECTFTREEIRQARVLLRDQQDELNFIEPGSSIATDAGSRYSRSTYFISAARAEGDLGLKIASFCTALEALFASDTVELTHQLAERAAAFLEEGVPQRFVLFSNLKRAYRIRSVVVHGAGSSAKKEEYSSLCCLLDDVLRRIHRVFATSERHRNLFSASSERFNEILVRRVFGESWDSLLT